MKKLLLASALASATLMSGCAYVPYQPGFLYSNEGIPLMVTNNTVGCEKHGSASATNILGWISTGDASIAAAKANGNITTVGNVDINFNNILGIVSHTTTNVCGK
jgi:hypothetical protein